MKTPSHYIYAAVILLIGLAFVGSYTYFRYEELEMKKQAQKEELQMKKQAQEKQEQEAADQAARQQANKRLRELCLSNADQEFLDSVKINGEKTKAGTYSVPTTILTQLEKRRHDAKELCFKKYPAY
jgi:hypothetical protein